MSSKNDKLVVLVGPTASGKTTLAIELAKKFNGEIICADSRTIYKGLDVGTAKPTPEEQAEVPHHLLDIVEPNQQFSVAEFKKLCEQAISDIQSRGKVPFLVGGSGMYIDSVLYNYAFREGTGVKTYDLTDEEVIRQAQQKYPAAYSQLEPGNIRRVRQLLERGPADKSDQKSVKIPCIIIGLGQNKLLLKQKIAQRTISMLNNKFIQEVEQLRKDYGDDNVLLQTTGYKQVMECLDGKISKSELPEAIDRATMALVKKQLSWFRRNQQIYWVDRNEVAYQIAESYLRA